MLLSIDWLTEFTPYSGSLSELADLLTMLGLEVEEQVTPFAALDLFLVGHVTSCTRHPNADKLSLCTVDLGSGRVEEIVCGAPNIAQGQNVCVAPVGSTMPDGQPIKEVRLRGQKSSGMILSEKEMGLSEDHSGILVLDQDLQPGTPVPQALGLDRVYFDLGITPNRADCLSILGVAREVAAACDLPLHIPHTEVIEADEECSDQLQVHIDDPDLCPLYQARIVDGITLMPSPRWMRYRLLGMGVRPINNVVDVTNYVMLERGQPLHAFDRSRLHGGLIRVGRAAEGQRFTTLDGQDRTLTGQDLLIWDANKPVALAGVMGGANSEIVSTSTTLVLESAVFDPASVRKTGRRLGLFSESAYRFERGVDQPGSYQALDRAAGLIHSLAGGRVLRGKAGSEPRPWHPVSLSFRPQRARDLLALDVDDSFCRRTLDNLGCTLDQTAVPWQVVPPSYRLDLQREVDLIEEIGRVYGLESIPTTLPRINKPLHPASNPDQDTAPYFFLRRIKAWAQGVGLAEVINYSFVGSRELDVLDVPVHNRVQVHNPLSSDQDTLRTVLIPGLLRNVRTNADQGEGNCRVFEVARVFESDLDAETTAREHTRLSLLLTGKRHPEIWAWNTEDVDYLDLKGMLETLFHQLHLRSWSVHRIAEHPFLHPAVSIESDSRHLGFMGRILPQRAKRAHAKSEIWVAELDLDRMYALYRSQKTGYQGWAKFPPVHRDMTVIAGPDVSYDQIEQVIMDMDHHLLEDCRLIDLYEPEKRQEQEKHLTLRMRYRHQERTLTDKEVDAEHAALGRSLVSSLPVRFPGE